ncbi:MAG: glycosyltransferase family 4 protein, partial [Phocaeicola sp.]
MKHLLYIGNKLALHGRNPTGIDTLGSLLEGEGYRLSYAASQKNKGLRFLMMLAKVSFVSNIDYVLIDTYSTTNFWYAFWVSRICRLRKIQYIPILHGGNLPERWKTHPRYCALLFGQAFKNVCPSFYLMQAFQTAGCPHLILIPNSISLAAYPFKPRIQPRPKLLWVRAFASIYHPTMAVEVLAALSKVYADAELCMVGPDKDGSLGALATLAQQLGVKVEFKGKLTPKEWGQLSEKYDFFINTTHFDNTPVSVIEAMGLGLGVVSTNVGGIPFLIEHAKEGWLVADSDVQ